MVIIQDELKFTNWTMVCFQRYFFKYNLTIQARENFARVIKEGLVLIKSNFAVFSIPDNFKSRIENYYVACYETMFAAAIEIPEENCEVREALLELKDQQLLVAKFLNGDLNEGMFI